MNIKILEDNKALLIKSLESYRLAVIKNSINELDVLYKKVMEDQSAFELTYEKLNSDKNQ